MSLPDDPPEWSAAPELQVSDPAAVEVLWHPAKRRHLAPFIGKTAGLAEAAQSLGIKKTAMSYWVGRLLDVGLIRLTGIDRSTRHKVPRYRCIADRLRVSLADAPMASYEAVFDDIAAHWHPLTLQALARSLARQAPWLDLSIGRAGPAGLATEFMPRASTGGAAAPPDDYLWYWGRLWLTPGEQQQMRQELDALWDKYAALSHKPDKPHAMLLHLVAVPESSR